jgi:hypothetical protein
MCPVTATSPWAAAPPPLPRRTTIIRIRILTVMAMVENESQHLLSELSEDIREAIFFTKWMDDKMDWTNCIAMLQYNIGNIYRHFTR